LVWQSVERQGWVLLPGRPIIAWGVGVPPGVIILCETAYRIRRVLVVKATWQLPSFKSSSGPLSWAANGWELGAIYKANDGVPFTATFGTEGDPLGVGSTDPYAYPNRLTKPGCSTLTNPRNPDRAIRSSLATPTLLASTGLLGLLP